MSSSMPTRRTTTSEDDMAGEIDPHDPPPRVDLALDRAMERRRRVIAAQALAPPAIAWTLPFLGPAISLATPFLATSLAPRVWRTTRRRAFLWGLLTVVVLWTSLVVAAVAFGLGGDAVAYQLIPLCAPTSTWTVLGPSAAGVLAYVAISTVAVASARIWLWPVAAAAGSVAFVGVWTLINGSTDWIC